MHQKQLPQDKVLNCSCGRGCGCIVFVYRNCRELRENAAVIAACFGFKDFQNQNFAALIAVLDLYLKSCSRRIETIAFSKKKLHGTNLFE